MADLMDPLQTLQESLHAMPWCLTCQRNVRDCDRSLHRGHRICWPEPDLDRRVAEAVAQERARCAAICDNEMSSVNDDRGGLDRAGQEWVIKYIQAILRRIQEGK